MSSITNSDAQSKQLSTTGENHNTDNQNFSAYRRVEGTPFATVEKDGLFYLAFSDYLITLGSQSHEEAESLIPLELSEQQWHTLIGFMNACTASYIRWKAEQNLITQK